MSDVKAGQPISARLWNAMLATVKRSRPLPGAGIVLRQTPQGTVIEAAGSQGREFLLGRVVTVNGDASGNFSHALPSAITYGVRLRSRPDLGVVSFGPAQKIIRSVRGDEFQVWPMAIGTPVCVMRALTGITAAPEALWLVAIEAPFTEPCPTSGGASP